MAERLWSIEDVARNLSVSATTVRRWIRNKKIIGQKAGSQWRFDPKVVSHALESGLLGNTALPPSRSAAALPHPPDWALATMSRWRTFVQSQLDQEQPNHVVVTDRRGSKVWSMLGFDRYAWGDNLWHSGALRLMIPGELQSLFKGTTVTIFDEILQHGRDMRELRTLLEDAGATVLGLVCVRRRSQAERGELLEYEAVACEDLDNRQFAERASFVSRLTAAFAPPLDVDHLVVKTSLESQLTASMLLERLATWGKPAIVWQPGPDHSLLAVTLDRPQFFETAGLPLLEKFKIDWAGPCKLRLYIDLESRCCYCSFIVYPSIEGAFTSWSQVSSVVTGARQLEMLPHFSTERALAELTTELRRAYTAICLELSVNFLHDFVSSGAAESMGLSFEDCSPEAAVDLGHLRASFGPALGDITARQVKEILGTARQPKSLFPWGTSRPPALFAKSAGWAGASSYDTFSCRADLLRHIPRKHDAGSKLKHRSVSYRNLLTQLNDYSESTIGRVLDFELDRGTMKPAIEIEGVKEDAGRRISISRGFYRGEFGVWFEWDGEEPTHDDSQIQRTLGLCPSVMQQFLERTNRDGISATHFAKLFANLQHDWRSAYGALYLGWRPYKYGPIPVVPIPSPSGEHLSLDHFLLQRECINKGSKQHGYQKRAWYRPRLDSPVPWATLYEKRTDGVTRSHVRSLIRLYAAIQQECTTTRLQSPRSSRQGVFHDPLIVLGSVRNEAIAYRCGWFEVVDWRRKGEETIFPLIGGLAEASKAPIAPFLRPHLAEFAQPARLLFDKLEMYRNLPHLRQQIVSMREEYDASEILLETVDEEPRFDLQSEHPMQRLDWACAIMRAFSSFVRQVMSNCMLDVDVRGVKRRGGRTRDADFFLEELLCACGELKPLAEDLRSCIKESQHGMLTMDISESLNRAFRLITNLFEGDGRIPDPRPVYERRREHLQSRDGLLVRFTDIQLMDPYAIAVADIRNLKNLPSIGNIFGVAYDDAMESLLSWVEAKAKGIVKKFTGVEYCGLTGDSVILAGHNAEEVYRAIMALMSDTSRRVAEIERQLEPFGLLRAGMAWHDRVRGEAYQGVRPGLIAYEIGDRSGRPPGAIAVTTTVHGLLEPSSRQEFSRSEDEVYFGEGIWIREPRPSGDKSSTLGADVGKSKK